MKRLTGLGLVTLLSLLLQIFAGIVIDQGRAIQERPSLLLGVPSVDVSTQRGGAGELVPSPPFCPDEEVILYARVTFSDFPEQNKLVAFQIFDSYGETYILYGTTNESGIASKNFRLRKTETLEDLGTCRIVATVNVAETIVEDRMEFQVPFNLADVNGDLMVDIFDVVTTSAAYSSTVSDSRWNVNCDVSRPYGLIDLLDLVLVAAAYGQQWNSG